jgi:ATP-binding cassette subfamily B protein
MRNNYVRKAFQRFMKQNKSLMAGLILAVSGVVILSLLPPQILRTIVDHNLVPKSGEGLMQLATAYIAVILLIGIFDFVKEGLLTVIGQKITKELRSEMMEKVTHLNMTFFIQNGSGTIVSRFMNDVDALNSMFTQGIVGMIIDCFKMIGIVISIGLFNLKLGLITLVLLPSIYALTRFFQKRMLAAQVKNRIITGRVNNHIGESVKNIRTIKTFSKESYMESRYAEYLQDNYRTIEKVNFYDSVFPPIIQVTRAVLIILIIILSSEQLNFLGISLGMIAASIELISNLFTPVEQLGMELQSIQQAVSGIRRVNDFFEEQDEESKRAGLIAEEVVPFREQAVIEFQDVSFRYGEGEEVLKDITLRISPLEKVTFTGRTGVGKSTLFKLVLGLLKPEKGSITLNGVDVLSIPNSEKRKLFGYVEQGFHLIRGTAAEQISLKDTSITRDQIERAIGLVGMTEYILGMEKGLDTPVDDTMFSQGQKQLLSIARAIVTDPPVLLLDEITSNLDSLTEEKILSVLQKAGAARIILSISHRLSSILSGDTVVLLEMGRIKNTGTPKDLLEQDEWYRSQLSLEKLTWD